MIHAPADSREVGNVFEWQRAIRGVPKGDLSALARFTLLALASFADPDGSRIRPSLLTLAETMGRSRSVAQSGVRELVERGWLVRQARPGHPTVYVPRVPVEVTEQPVTPSPGGDRAAGHQVTEQPVTTTSIPRQEEEDAGARDLADDDPEADQPPGVKAWWLVVQAAHVLGCPPSSWPSRHDPVVVALVDQVAAGLSDGADPDELFARLTRWKAPRRGVDCWPALLASRLTGTRHLRAVGS